MPDQERLEQNAQRYQEVMMVIGNYEQSDLIDLISDLMSQSPIITNIVHEQLIES